MPLHPVNLAPAREQVAAVLRRAILAGEYESGTLLTLESVAQSVGVSRTPVREAFQILAAENLLELRPNRGALVIGLSPEMVADHFDMRILLEGEAVYRACRRGLDLKQLERFVDEGALAAKYNEIHRFTRCNARFHEAIWEAAGSEKLKSFLSQLWKGAAVDQAVSREAYMAEAQQEHEELLSALKTRDPIQARAFMVQHLKQSRIHALRAMEEQFQRKQTKGERGDSSPRIPAAQSPTENLQKDNTEKESRFSQD